MQVAVVNAGLLSSSVVRAIEEAGFTAVVFSSVNDCIAGIELNPVAALVVCLYQPAEVWPVCRMVRSGAIGQRDMPIVLLGEGGDPVFERVSLVNLEASCYVTLDALAQVLVSHPVHGEGHRYRVLHIDDNLDHLNNCAKALGRDGRIEVKSLLDPLQAFSLIGEFKPDVVITDLSMPDISGEDLCFAIQECFPWVAILVASGFISSEKQARFLMAGIDIVQKPWTLEQMRWRVNVLLSRLQSSVYKNTV
jgi:DNA-binding response OmpR family regulator